MARLIDADALMDVIRQHEYRLATKQGSIDYGMFTLGIQQAVDEQPTVDAVEVVRCKDCKHFRHYGKTSLFINGKNIKAGWCQRRIRYDEECRMTADDFCSYGERKDGDENG